MFRARNGYSMVHSVWIVCWMKDVNTHVKFHCTLNAGIWFKYYYTREQDEFTCVSFFNFRIEERVFAAILEEWWCFWIVMILRSSLPGSLLATCWVVLWCCKNVYSSEWCNDMVGNQMPSRFWGYVCTALVVRKHLLPPFRFIRREIAGAITKTALCWAKFAGSWTLLPWLNCRVRIYRSVLHWLARPCLFDLQNF